MNAQVTIIAVVWAVFAAGSVEGTEQQHDPPRMRDLNFAHRSLSAIQVDVRTALRAEALSRRLGPNASEVLRLINLYREMAIHPRRGQSVLLTQLGLQLRSRLEKVRDRIERQNSHPDRRAKEKEVLPALAFPETHVLAQQVAVPGGAALVQHAQPPANQPLAARTIDYGPDLVELIQRTISPATWDINGGNGSVVYFTPLQAMVVSAPGTVHDQIDDVLRQLRAGP